MKIDFSQAFKNIDGSPIVMKIDGPPLTLANAAQTAMLEVSEEDRHMDGEQKVRHYRIAMVVSPGVIDLALEDIALIKQRVGKVFAPLVVGQAWAMLEGAAAGAENG